MFKKSKSALFLMGSFLGGLGASFVSYAANDASFLLDDDGPIDDFDDNNLGKLVFSDQESSLTSTDLGVKENSPSGGVADDLSITEGNTPKVDLNLATGDSATGKIDVFSSDSEIGKNLDTSIDAGKETDDYIDVLNLKNDINTGDVLDNTTDQGIAGSGEIDGLYNNKVDNDLNSPLDVGKDVTIAEDLGDLYSEGNNNNKLDKPDDPTKDVPNPTKIKKVNKGKVNRSKSQKSVSEKNNGLKLLGGLATSIGGTLALIKYNKGLKSSGWLDKLINMIKSLWMPEDAATSADDKNPEVKDPQQTDVEKPGEEPIGSVAPSDLNTPETDKEHVSDPNENVDQDQGGIYDGASVFSILVKLFGVIGAVLLLIFILKEKSGTKESKKEKGGTQEQKQGSGKLEEKEVQNKTGDTTNPKKREIKPSLISRIRKEFEEINKDDKIENSKNYHKEDDKVDENIKLRKSVNLYDMLNQKKNNIFRKNSMTYKKIGAGDLIKKHEERKLQAAQKAINECVDEGKIKEIIEEEYIQKNKLITAEYICTDLNISVEKLNIGINEKEIADLTEEEMAGAVKNKLKEFVEDQYGENIRNKIKEAVSAEEERIKKEEEEKQRLEEEKKLKAAQKVINEVVIPDNVKKIIKGAFKDLETYRIEVDKIYGDRDDSQLRSKIKAEEIVKVDQNVWQVTVESKLKEEVKNKYESIVQNKVEEAKNEAQSFINQYVTTEKVKEVAESILTENRIIKGKIEEKKEKAILRIFGIDILCTEEKLLELKRKITADEIAKVENNAWGSTVGEKIKDLIKNSVTKKVENFRDILKKMLKSKDEISKRIIAKKYLQKFKNMANKLKKEEGVSRIGANFKGYLARKKLGKLKKRKELLKKIVENEDFKDKQLAVKNSFFKLKNVNEKLKSAEKAIEDGITEGKIKEIIQTEYIKENKAITADAIYKSLNVNIDALKEKIKVEEIAKLKKEEVAGAVQEKLKEVLKNKYGKNIENKIQEAMRKEKERIEKEEEERKKKEKLNNENKIEEEKKDDTEKKKILEIYDNFKKNRSITKKDDVIKIEILSSKYPAFLKEGFLKGNKDSVKDRDILVFELLKRENNVVLKAKGEFKVNQAFFRNTSVKGEAWYNAFYTFERSSDLLNFLSLDANNINSSSRKNLRDNDSSAPITSQKKGQNKKQPGSDYKKINNTTEDKKKEKEKNNEKKYKYNINLNLISEFNKQDGKSNKKNHFEHRILYINNNNNNIIRPNNYLPIKNEIIIDNLSKTDHKFLQREEHRENEERKINFYKYGFFEEGEKTERESNTEKKPPLPYLRKYTNKVNNSSELKDKMFEKTVPFENIKEIFTKYRDKLVELGKKNYKKDGSTFSVESSDMQYLKLTYYWKNGKVCNSGSFILEQKMQGEKNVWIFSHNVEKSADGAKKEQKEIYNMEELRPQGLKTVFENMSSFFKKITCCSSSFYVKYMNETNEFVFEDDIKSGFKKGNKTDSPYDKYGYNNHNNYYNNNDY